MQKSKEKKRPGKIPVHIVPCEGRIRGNLLLALKLYHKVFSIVQKPHKASVIFHDDHVSLRQVKVGPNEKHILLIEEDEFSPPLSALPKGVAVRKVADVVNMITSGDAQALGIAA